MEKNFKSWKRFAPMEKEKAAHSPRWENHREEIQTSRTFHLANDELWTHKQPLSPLLPAALINFILLSVSLNLPVLGTSYKQHYTVFVFLCLVYFTWHSVSKCHLCNSMCPHFFPFSGQIIFHCMQLGRGFQLLTSACPSVKWSK